MRYLITIQETSTRLADQFETIDPEEAQAWAEDPTVIVTIQPTESLPFIAELDALFD